MNDALYSVCGIRQDNLDIERKIDWSKRASQSIWMYIVDALLLSTTSVTRKMAPFT